MMKAILVPYACDQNAPSKPISKLYTIPTDTEQRDEELKVLFQEHVCFSEEDLGLTICKDDDPYGYSDLYVVDQSGEMFLFVTYVHD